MATVLSAFHEGVTTAEIGMCKEDNPTHHSDWNAGYDAATKAGEATKLDYE
ncbi:hypothetical protein [Sinorhizobium fredii]|uniref:hypothetical protein n=1 Tax=Rhizobium fredii TaxID=380 RepID=UPI0013040EC0|nr:hypothetical protein [Sinorhizobium fredii]